MSNKVIEKLNEAKIVAVIRKVDTNKVEQLVQALHNGGISAVEITMDSADCLTHIKSLKAMYDDKLMIGAGTVLSKTEAEAAINAGADFVVAPILDEATVNYCNAKQVAVIPGVFSPTEVYKAYALGAPMVKLFPATVLGSQFVKDIKGPLSNIPLMTTGGMDVTNMTEFIEAGVEVIGVGGSLINKAWIEEDNWDSLEQLAKQYVEKVKA